MTTHVHVYVFIEKLFLLLLMSIQIGCEQARAYASIVSGGVKTFNR